MLKRVQVGLRKIRAGYCEMQCRVQAISREQLINAVIVVTQYIALAALGFYCQSPVRWILVMFVLVVLTSYRLLFIHTRINFHNKRPYTVADVVWWACVVYCFRPHPPLFLVAIAAVVVVPTVIQTKRRAGWGWPVSLSLGLCGGVSFMSHTTYWPTSAVVVGEVSTTVAAVGSIVFLLCPSSRRLLRAVVCYLGHPILGFPTKSPEAYAEEVIVRRIVMVWCVIGCVSTCVLGAAALQIMANYLLSLCIMVAVATVTLSAVGLWNFYLALTSRDAIVRIGHLVMHLLLCATALIITKNEQYVPLLVLTECGTLLILFNVIKHSQRSSWSSSHWLLLTPPVMIFFWPPANRPSVYWFDTQTAWLTTPPMTADFSGLSAVLLMNITPGVINLFLLLLTLTLIFITIQTLPTRPLLLRPLTKAQLRRLGVQSTNGVGEPVKKEHAGTITRFTK